MTKGCQVVVAALALGVALAGCGGAPHRSLVPPLTRAALREARYATEFSDSGVVQLVHGEYRLPVAPGSADEVSVSLADSMAFGDFDGDGDIDAGAVLVGSGGGSGTFYHLVAVLNDRGTPRHLASVLLGDRIKIQRVTIHRDTITVSLIRHGPADPQCCPTQAAVEHFVLQGSTLQPLEVEGDDSLRTRDPSMES
jgi:hypothetical protein